MEAQEAVRAKAAESGIKLQKPGKKKKAVGKSAKKDLVEDLADAPYAQRLAEMESVFKLTDFDNLRNQVGSARKSTAKKGTARKGRVLEGLSCSETPPFVSLFSDRKDTQGFLFLKNPPFFSLFSNPPPFLATRTTTSSTSSGRTSCRSR